MICATAAALIGGFIVWLNYGQILWDLQARQNGRAASALDTLGDAWEIQSRTLSGPYAINCGRVPIGGSSTTATDCALKAFHEGRPFRVRYDLMGIDSSISAGLVFTPGGVLYGLTFDGDPMGGGGTSWSRQRAAKQACPLPYQVYTTPTGRLNCFPSKAVASQDVMSPTFESY